MSDAIKHECGLAVIRLLKPLDYYQEKYGTALYGLKKMHLLLMKQRNRGQDGAGVATIKLDMSPGTRYISRRRSNDPQYIKHLFDGIYSHFKDCTPDQLEDGKWLKANRPYTGELLLGHLRYGTHGINTVESVHPFLRQNNWKSRNLVVAGNFNLTNVEELFNELILLGQYPKEKSDTVTVLEKIGHFLDEEVDRLHSWFKAEGYNNQQINKCIEDNLDVQRLLQRSCRKFDGGFVMAGMIGHGDAFVLRDPSGIRPAFYYHDDEVAVVTSERPAIQTVFNVRADDVKELGRGNALIIRKGGSIAELPYKDKRKSTPCSFERIYFSRGTDRDIYKERKKLGENVCDEVLDAIDFNLKDTIFCFIPNTAEIAFYGLIEGVNKRLFDKVKKTLKKQKIVDVAEIERLLEAKPRIEKLAVKEVKMRTFIADDSSRGELVSHAYDVTYGVVRNGIDTVVAVDDSIVRGTTLKEGIIQILSRLKPKKIIIVSSAPQIRYPDCYGIDMSRMKNFAAFRALIALLKETKKDYLLDKAYKCAITLQKNEDENQPNVLQDVYAEFSYKEITNKIAEILTPKNVKCEVQIIYQRLEGLHDACPNNRGDWYFSGNYPTPGGNRVSNKAFINYMENIATRAY
ncbi:MAG: amidophosphoribosyltransferase [Saprospiraceae bacterium]